MKKQKLIVSLLNILVLCIVVIATSAFFISNEKIIGFALISLGLLCLFSLKIFKITISSVKPDIIFGVIDNGILAAMAVLGGEIAGVAGAIAGGVVGNAVTDGIAGLFEGYWAEKNPLDHRTVLGSSIGKMAGCLLGAGSVLVILSFFFAV